MQNREGLIYCFIKMYYLTGFMKKNNWLKKIILKIIYLILEKP